MLCGTATVCVPGRGGRDVGALLERPTCAIWPRASLVPLCTVHTTHSCLCIGHFKPIQVCPVCWNHCQIRQAQRTPFPASLPPPSLPPSVSCSAASRGWPARLVCTACPDPPPSARPRWRAPPAAPSDGAGGGTGQRPEYDIFAWPRPSSHPRGRSTLGLSVWHRGVSLAGGTPPAAIDHPLCRAPRPSNAAGGEPTPPPAATRAKGRGPPGTPPTPHRRGPAGHFRPPSQGQCSGRGSHRIQWIQEPPFGGDHRWPRWPPTGGALRCGGDAGGAGGRRRLGRVPAPPLSAATFLPPRFF